MNYWKVLNSPFKPFKLRFYAGKVAIGTPYFFPRKWVNNPDKPGYLKAIPKKIGFDFVQLGWKTKWRETDYRFEYSPLISFVFFKWQIAIMINAPESDRYWEAWLFYERNTDKTKSKKERIQQCKEEFPLNCIVYRDNVKESIDYYTKILKPKYLK